MTKKEQILELRGQGLSYNEIQKRLNCSKSLIAYYCNDTAKDKHKLNQQKRRSKQHSFQRKIERFNYETKHTRLNKKPIHHNQKVLYDKVLSFNKRGDKNTMITLQEVQDKFGEHTICYLTGEPIDVTKPRTYHFDHKVPVSKNGDNSIDNLGICTKEVNMAKRDLTPDEFIALCKKVLIHNGYKVEK